MSSSTASKAFRAELPALREEELERLRAWSAQNCAASVLLRESDCVVWLGARERPKTREGFLRSIRATLKGLGIDTRLIKGKWVALTTEEIVRSEVAGAAVTTCAATSIAVLVLLDGLDSGRQLT